MKSFAAIVLLGASAATAQVTLNSTSGLYTCAPANPNGNYCAGDSLATNIIIRCTNGVGQPGNCNDNLAGEPPLGVNYAPCFETSPTSGDAACSKNCIVYEEKTNGTKTLSDCTPSSTETSAYSPPASSTGYPTYAPGNGTTVSTTVVATVTTVCSSSKSTWTSVYVTTYAPTSSSVATYSAPSNGTYSTSAATSAGASATGTPSAPAPIVSAGAGVANRAGPLAAAGLFMAYLL